MTTFKKLQILATFVLFLVGDVELFTADDHSIKAKNLKASNDAQDDMSVEFATGIVNGSPASRLKYPFMAFIKVNNRTTPICGATIISPRWILTAAHCIVNKGKILVGPGTAKIGAGAIFKNNAHLYEIEKVILHSSYNWKMAHKGYDISLIKLANPLVFNHQTIGSIDLPSFSKIYDGPQKLKVAGWGAQQDGANKINPHLPHGNSNSLREVNQYFVNPKRCLSILKTSGYEMMPMETHVCTNGGEEKGDACQGDSGGPLFQRETPRDARYTQFGIVSTGIGCARGDLPGLYTMVSFFTKWIEDLMNKY